MKKDYVKKSKLILFLGILLLFSACGQQRFVKGQLDIQFQLMPSKDNAIVPSFQTVVWLEDTTGTLLHTLQISEYLAYGGYNDSTICQDWNCKSDWGHVDETVFDAVTKATPAREEIITVTVDCQALGLIPGNYIYGVETHVLEDKNILYKGKIYLGNKDVSNTATNLTAGEIPPNIQVLQHVSASLTI